MSPGTSTIRTGRNIGTFVDLLRQGRSFSGRERNCCFLNLGDGRFADVSAVSGFDFPDDARGLAKVDWDHDGDLDLWVTNRNGPQVRLLRNDVANGNHWLALRLVGNGTTSNRDAVGARVELDFDGEPGPPGPPGTAATGLPLLATVRAGDAFLSQSTKWLHFGLAGSEEIERATVRWPDGTAEEFTGLAADSHYRLVQGSGRAEWWHRPAPTPSALQPAPLASPAKTANARVLSAALLPLPSIEYRTFSGEMRQVMDSDPQRPTAILLNLWASWCQPCLDELQEFTSAQDRIRGANVDIVALSVDGLAGDSNASAEIARELITDRIGFPFRTGIAAESTIEKLQLTRNEIFDLDLTLAVPTSFLLDSEGRIAAIYRGPISVDQLLDDVEQLPLELDRLLSDSLPFPGRWQGHVAYLDPYQVNLQLLDRGFLDDGARYLDQNSHLYQDEAKIAALRFKLASAQHKAGDTKQAARNYRAGLKYVPNNAEAYVFLGDILMLEDRTSDAIREYRQALKNDGDNNRALNNIAVALTSSGEIVAATDHLQRLVKLAPNNPQAHFHLAMVLASQQNIADAIRHLRRAASLVPNDTEVLHKLAVMLATIGNISEAVLYFQRIVELAPDDEQAHFDLAKGFLAQGESQLAIRHLRRAIELDPNSSKATTNSPPCWSRATTSRRPRSIFSGSSSSSPTVRPPIRTWVSRTLRRISWNWQSATCAVPWN